MGTIDRFEAAVKKRGFMVFARLDHAAAAESVGLKMPRATVIVFGNPRLGTPGFIKTPTLAIDLPLKVMVWEDANGKVWLSYNLAEYLHGTIYVRHGAPTDKAVGGDATTRRLERSTVFTFNLLASRPRNTSFCKSALSACAMADLVARVRQAA
jgi:uncharacterized protein (DUF302 family)